MEQVWQKFFRECSNGVAHERANRRVDCRNSAGYNAGMSDSGEPSFHAILYQWSARASMIAFEMVVPAVIGVGLDRLCGTVALFAILGAILGMALGFWQLLKIAGSQETGSWRQIDSPNLLSPLTCFPFLANF